MSNTLAIETTMTELAASLVELDRERDAFLQNYEVKKARLEDALSKAKEVYYLLGGENTNSLQALQPAKRKWQGLPKAIEEMLRSRGEEKVMAIVDELRAKGFETNRQTVTGILENYKKKGVFKRVGRATYALANN